ncbi:Uridine nucleosidase 1 [Ascosphaera aggregata]|nr:Uridine nucleosidase 1 [Ascosphaera aggregata]
MTVTSPQQLSEARIPLWLDCDPGHDDVFAILIAAHHPNLRLLGISTVHGNGSIDNVTKNAGSVLNAIGRTDIPVYKGASKPFCRPAIHAENIHGDSGLDGTDLLPEPAKPAILDNKYLTAMRDAVLAEPRNTVFIVGTGTYTNLGLLFASYPEVAEHVAGVSLMGGAVGNGFTKCPISLLPEHSQRVGNWTEFAEFNVYCDPEAAQSIFSSPVLAPKTVIVSLDLTHTVIATPEVLQSVLYANPETRDTSNLRQMLYELLTFFTKTYRQCFGLVEGPPLHDPLAVAVLLSNLNVAGRSTEEYAEVTKLLKFDDRDGERFKIDVITDGKHFEDRTRVGQLGRTVVTPLKGDELGNGGVAIPRGVDLNAFWSVVTDCIRRADALNAQSLEEKN